MDEMKLKSSENEFPRRENLQVKMANPIGQRRVKHSETKLLSLAACDDRLSNESKSEG